MTGGRPPGASLLLGGLGGLLLLAALVADALYGRRVTLMTNRRTETEAAQWRTLRAPLDDPAEIYGQPLPGAPARLLFPPWQPPPETLRVPERPGQELLFVDETPPPHLRAGPVLGTARVLGALLLALGVVVALRRPPSPR